MQCGLTYREVLDTPWKYVRAFLAVHNSQPEW